MIIGFGTGSTARFAVERLGESLRSGKLQDVAGIPSSLQTEKLARQTAVPLTDLCTHPVIDITVDGADEVDADLNMIKGGGGALLREKVLAQASKRNIIIVDAGKISSNLGDTWSEILYDEAGGNYYNFDMVGQNHNRREIVFGYMRLLAGIPDGGRG